MDLVLPYQPLPGEGFNKGDYGCLFSSQHSLLVCFYSVQLARRVLQLEKINVSLKIEQENKQEALSKLQDKVNFYCHSLAVTHSPGEERRVAVGAE